MRVSNGLYPDQNRRSVCTDLGQTIFKCYQLTTKEWGTWGILNTNVAKHK